MRIENLIPPFPQKARKGWGTRRPRLQIISVPSGLEPGCSAAEDVPFDSLKLRLFIRWRQPYSTAAGLSDGGDSGLRALAVLVTVRAGDANGSDDLASGEDGQTALDGNGVFQPKHAHAGAAAGQGVLKRLGGALEER